MDLSDDGNDTDDEAYSTFHLNMITVRAHLEYAEAPWLPQKIYAISDCGADSTILGKYAKVLHHTNHYANLVGYDPQTTRTEKAPIVCALIKTRSNTEGSIPVLLCIHEAPLLANSPTITLISEYQVRIYGLVVDSVAKKHRSGDGRYGQQCLQLSENLAIPFEDRGGLMAFEILPVEDGDKEIYDIIPITGQAQWTPRQFMDQETPTSAHTVAVDPDPDIFVDADHGFHDPVDHDKPSLGTAVHLTMSNPGANVPYEDADSVLDFLSYAELLSGDCYHESHVYQASSGNPTQQPLIEEYDVLYGVSGDYMDYHAYSTTKWHRVIHEKNRSFSIATILGWTTTSHCQEDSQPNHSNDTHDHSPPAQTPPKIQAPHMNVTHLDEVVFTDPMFANCRSLYHGHARGTHFLWNEIPLHQCL